MWHSVYTVFAQLKSVKQLHVHNFELIFIVRQREQECIWHDEHDVKRTKVHEYAKVRSSPNVMLLGDQSEFEQITCRSRGARALQPMTEYMCWCWAIALVITISCIVNNIKLLLLMVQVEKRRVSKHEMGSLHRWFRLTLVYSIYKMLHLPPVSITLCHQIWLDSFTFTKACRILLLIERRKLCNAICCTRQRTSCLKSRPGVRRTATCIDALHVAILCNIKYAWCVQQHFEDFQRILLS